MINYIECRNILLKKPLTITNENFEELYHITYLKNNKEFSMEITNIQNNTKYYVKTNPLKLKPKHIIYNEGKEELARVRMGVKIIHSIIESQTYYFVKSAFWKIKYQVFNNRQVEASLEVIRKNNKRYFKITSHQDDFILSLALFLLAQAVRHKAIMN